MEKNKEWLKKEVEDYLAIEGVYDARTALKAVLEYIDQLDEPNEIELSEPSAWKTIAKLYHPNEVYWGNVRDSYLESLDEPERVVIPQFVADWIEGNRQEEEAWEDYNAKNALNDSIHFTIYGLFANYPTTNTHVELRKPTLEWLNYDRSNYFKLVEAVKHGYTVEKEKQYYVYDKATKSYLGYNAVRTQLNWWTSRLENESFTEQEIKAIDERFWAFAEEITK